MPILLRTILIFQKQPGAPTFIYGPKAEAGFDVHVAKDGEVFTLGNIKLKCCINQPRPHT